MVVLWDKMHIGITIVILIFCLLNSVSSAKSDKLLQCFYSKLIQISTSFHWKQEIKMSNIKGSMQIIYIETTEFASLS